jgi:tryptophan-rich sensory protein
VVVFVLRITKPNACWTRNIVLWLMILKPTFNLQKINKIAGYLFIPYFVGEFCCGVEWKYLVVE